jgi:hypothetical protein
MEWPTTVLAAVNLAVLVDSVALQMEQRIFSTLGANHRALVVV